MAENRRFINTYNIFLPNLFQSQVIDALFLQLNQNMKTDCHLIYAIVGQTVTETV